MPLMEVASADTVEAFASGAGTALALGVWSKSGCGGSLARPCATTMRLPKQQLSIVVTTTQLCRLLFATGESRHRL